MDPHTLEVLEYGRIRQLLQTYASSGLAQRRATELSPLTDAAIIAERLAETSEMKALLAPDRTLPVGGFHDLFPLCQRLKDGEDLLTGEELLLVRDTLAAAEAIRAYLAASDEEYPLLRRMALRLQIHPQLQKAIDTAFGAGGRLLDAASPALRAARKQIKLVRGRLQSKVQAALRAHGAYLQDTGIRERKGRPALAVKAQHVARVPGVRRDQSASGGTVFIEPEGVRPLANELEAALHAEKAEELRILRHLTAQVSDSREKLEETLDLLAHIDLTYAKVRFSRAYDMHAPDLDKEGRIRLDQARHPLLLVREDVAEVVPIDLRLGGDFHTLIITGPNTGGKTAALKTLGLLCLMAQSGLHIPAAAGSCLPVFSRIDADIGDEQSLEQSLSTFSAHLTHIRRILQHAGPDSLVLLDELGGGTDPAEGAALARAILEYLHTRQARTAVTTHISQLKDLAYTTAGMENASVEFDEKTLSPTHRLLIGTPGSSNALAVAQRLGLPAEVLQNALRPPDTAQDEAAQWRQQIQTSRALAREHERQLERLGAALDAEEKAESLDARLAQREAELGHQTRRDGRQALETLAARLEALRRSDGSRQTLIKALREIAAQARRHLDGDIEPLSFKEGDAVQVKSLGKQGEVRRLDPDAGKAVVLLGPLEMTVSLDDLTPVDP